MRFFLCSLKIILLEFENENQQNSDSDVFGALPTMQRVY